ncbi:hypothetical protein A2641_01085 [Candidatus Nomurabacteria bacterium RIFCSPHIGHO2_01_FULL_37_25]|uniref:Nudix hydrolase domain-containing protein n=1 Tax=Candidatus Nomurabacteria bacterium RIFCSPLOWO2_01_FULL_36_16 TaxID=1801767 RepID=A0A1F6WYW2_9BACT|nr:MAG: hypothetical protein A2641_01085 [Candidatus Nomurabacteria bacterium RIFCSPHIGHO2_01_FULL_37_25]OGI75313.1 MAG: hypothetical protein A3D36_01985 [Candidatus Nomurabacteria bacterium RIFCSPHIGHO2_02_FULL_36_29]OGI87060.1 MAG: hypothetical protein A3A91_00080 [Candidatus Nomurabacteria bacterium RIFCSPLOWO2_01_FULL_36_16]OGI95925.1 MAG: hypothetical protein A3I84_01230 [Candidatus Nomurabacteria bacterium RIFCSPLOWO2_02_FULL_36_8]
MDELINTVDENDVITGEQLKSICHRDKILHRGASIFCFEDNNLKRVLINKRSMNISVEPGALCVPGGHLTIGESYIDGAEREFTEEMLGNNFTGKIKLEELFKIKKFTDNDYGFETIFRTVYAGGFSPDPHEVESFYFEDISEVIKEIKNAPEKFTETTILLFNEYAKRYLK